ncbi:serine/arginine repetitive matrix protein 2 isoform X2 [Culicoides brevitarsis]
MVTNTSPWQTVQTGGGGNNATWFNRNNQQISPTFIQSPNNILSTTPATTFITTKPLNNHPTTTILRPIQAKRSQPVTLLTVVPQQKSLALQNKPPLAPKPPPIAPSTPNSHRLSPENGGKQPESAAKENISGKSSDISSRVELFGGVGGTAAPSLSSSSNSFSQKSEESGVFKVPEAKITRPKVNASKNISSIALEKKAEEVTNKALKNISKMDIDRLKQIINKPNIEYERVLQNVATKRIRSRMQEKLRNFKLTESNEPVVEPDECIDAEKIPDAFLSEIDRVLDLNMFDNTSESDSDVICVNDKEDSDVLDQNLGLSNDPPDRIINPEDIFLRAEILLMGDTSMLEPRSNDCSVASTRNTTPIDEMMTHIDESLYKSEPEIVSIDDDDTQDVKNVNLSGDKPEINFVNCNEMPTLDIPLPESNPLQETNATERPLKRAPGDNPIKFKLQPKKFDKISLNLSPAAVSSSTEVRKLSPLPDVPQPKKSRSRSKGRSRESSSRTPSRSPRRSNSPYSRDRSSYSKDRRKSKHRDHREDRRDKYYDSRDERRERKKKRRERREQREELYYNRNEHHRYRSPSPESRSRRTSSPDDAQERPRLDLKSKLMNLDAIKAGAIFNAASSNNNNNNSVKQPNEPSKTESLKNYRHIRDKSRSESNSPPIHREVLAAAPIPSSSSSTTTTNFLSNSVTSLEDSATKKKRRRKRRSRTKSPSEERGTPPLTIAVTTPPVGSELVDSSSEKQILQISPKLKVEIKVLSTKTPEPEIRANTKANEVDFNQDIESELVATAVINKKTFEEIPKVQTTTTTEVVENVQSEPPVTEVIEETPPTVPEPVAAPEESVIMIAPQPVQHETLQPEQQIVTVCQNQPIYSMITVTEATKLQAMQNVIAAQQSQLDTLADGLLDEIVEMEQQEPSKEAAQTYEAIAQNLIEEVVKHSPPNQSHAYEALNNEIIAQQAHQAQQQTHFSPPQNISSTVYQSPVAQMSYHSSPSTSLIHMSSPASQFHQSPAHSIHSMHSIYSPASCHAYPNQSPMQNIAISPRQTLQIVPENPLSNVSMHSNHDHIHSQHPYVMQHHDTSLHLSPEQVQQVASLHNTPLHDTASKQENTLMDEIVRNLMLNNDVVDVPSNSVMNSYSSCVQDRPAELNSNSYDGTESNLNAESPRNYTSPIRNDVFLHQTSMSQEETTLQPLTQQQQHAMTPVSVQDQPNTTHEPMDIERFSPGERLSEHFSEIPQSTEQNFPYQTEMNECPHSRSWRSPGEKKCMTTENRSEAEILAEKFVDETNVGHVPLTSFGSAPQPSPRDNEQWVDGRINLQVLQRMKEIDIQMMGLQKEKMSIDSMILKLQTDKMAIDQTTLRLQNERFILLNTIMNSYPQAMLPTPTATPQQGMETNFHTNNIVNRLGGLSPTSEKILSESVQATTTTAPKVAAEETETKSEKKSSKHRHDSTSDRKDKSHKSRKRSKSRDRSSSHHKKESKDKDRKKRSEHESRSHEKKRDRSAEEKRSNSEKREKESSKEQPKEKKEVTKPQIVEDPIALPDAPIKKTVIATKIQTPLPKPPIEAPKITIAMNTPSNVQIKTTIAKLPASIKTKVKHSFEEALSASSMAPAPLSKKLKEFKKEMSARKNEISSSESKVDPITLKLSDVHTVTLTETAPPSGERGPKSKRRPRSLDNGGPKRRRKETKPRMTKKRRERLMREAQVAQQQQQEEEEQEVIIKRPRRSGGKIMQMMMPANSDTEEEEQFAQSPLVINEPILSEEIDETIYLPDDFVLAANEEYEEEVYDNSVSHQMSLLNKECKIVLRKIDMERYLKKKPVDAKLESGLELSLPSSPEKDNLPKTNEMEQVMSDALSEEDDEEEEDIDETSSNHSMEEEDFEGIPEPPVWDGKFQGHDTPIVHLKVVGRYLIAASEDGAIYRYLWRTGKLEKVFREHTKVATHFTVDENQFVYSVSLDGYMKKFALENFTTSVESVHLSDLLQTIELCWNNAYIGTRNGRILVYDTQMNKLLIPPLCEINKPVNIIKASKEGPRKILMVGLKGNQIQIRDADNGLLLRNLCLTEKYTIYSLALDGGVIHCGTNSNEIVTLDFYNGQEVSRKKCGSGAISMKIYRNLLFTGCYDGFIYVHKKDSNKVVGKLHGPGKMLLDFELVDNKIIAAVKDKNLRIWDIAQDIISQTDGMQNSSLSS